MTNSEFVEKYLKAKLTDQQKMVIDLPSDVLVRAHRRFGKTHCMLLKMAAQWMQNPDKRFYFFSPSEQQSNNASEEFDKIIDGVFISSSVRKPEFRALGRNSHTRLCGLTGDYFYVDDYEWANDDQQTCFALYPIFYDKYSKNKPKVYYTATGRIKDWVGPELKIALTKDDPLWNQISKEISQTVWDYEYLLKD